MASKISRQVAFAIVINTTYCYLSHGRWALQKNAICLMVLSTLNRVQANFIVHNDTIANVQTCEGPRAGQHRPPQILLLLNKFPLSSWLVGTGLESFTPALILLLARRDYGAFFFKMFSSLS